MYDNHILTDVGCRNVWENGKKVGYGVNLKINYYRGLPLCCVDEIALEVDGEKVDPADMVVQHRGREYPYLEILKDDFPTDFYWVFGEMLRVVIKKENGIAQGRHQVKLKLATRRSYTPTMSATCEKTLTFA
ncbi:C-glycoside deglycosidase beta subunit domain-containing protein [Cohnella fermenti]|uniref:C-deglycosylation enzyme beta subunit n=1 Tax=Cohnella fermenti TaxID=2565925 RepID=A0A4S4BKQ5_9BACL|nr:DUF6379 domain-containing protein [Cohnella fermenti]THF75221.1 hypothetical protein E6C55_22395 [Cohnella fermenti]